MILPILAMGRNREQLLGLEQEVEFTCRPDYYPHSLLCIINQLSTTYLKLKFIFAIPLANKNYSIFMFRNNVYTFKNLPVQEKERHWTDCFCTICTAIFALIMFILSFVMYHPQNLSKVNYPVDDTGKTCGYERQNSPFVYFTNPSDISQGRYCVSKCPLQNQPLLCEGDQSTKCVTMGGSQYSTEEVQNRLGDFCIPKNKRLANKIWDSKQIDDKSSILNSLDVMLISLLIGFCVGLIYLLLMMCCPKVMTFLVFVISFILLLVAGIVILAKPIQFFDVNFFNILVALIFLFCAFAYLTYLWCYRKQLQLAGIFLHHANNFLKQTPLVFLYIPVFLILTFLLVILFIWQFIAFGTQHQPVLEDGKIYKTSKQNVALQVFNVIEFIWGLQFLRDAFNFVVSGNAVQWYFRNAQNSSQSHCFNPFKRLMTKNWGSVAAGSFLNAFFNIPDLITDCFRCDPDGPCGKCFSCYKVCCFCEYLFELVRNDSYAYINLAGVPFCNASRQCEAMCQYSKWFRGSQSCLRLYRSAAHIALVSLVSIICLFILLGRSSTGASEYVMAGIVFGAYCMSTYFIDVHADGAEGLMVCYLAEENCDGDEMDVCPLGLRNDLFNFIHQDQS